MIGTIAAWRAYATERGVSAPTDASDESATAALVRAGDYITHNYVRYFYEDYTVDSPYVEDATYEAALLELNTAGFFSATYTPGKQKILSKVEGISWTVVDSDASRPTYVPVSTAVDQMLRHYMRRNFVVGFLSTSEYVA